MTRGSGRAALAAALVVALQLVSLPAPAAPLSVLTGTVVLGAENSVPLAGATVHLADASTGAVAASAKTSETGAFRAEGLAPATYRVGIETNGRLYAVATPVTLAPGQVQSVTMAVPTNAQKQPTPSQDEKDKGGLTWWNNPLTASLIVVGGAVILGILIDQATDDDEPTPSSPSAPQG
jgi:hypothetical protein